MFGKILKKRSSVIISWIFSYIAVLIFPIIFGIIYYNLSMNSIKQEILQSNRMLLSQISAQGDNIYYEVNRMGAYISVDNSVAGLLKSDISNSEKSMLLKNLSDSLKTYQASADIVDDVYIYFSEIDAVISSSAGGDTQTFYNSIIKSSGIEYQEWINKLNKNYRGENAAVKRVEINGNIVNSVGFMKSLPINRFPKTATIVTMVDEDKFLDNLPETYIQNGGQLMVYNKSNTPVAMSDNQLSERINIDEILSVDNVNEMIKIAGKQYLLAYVTSEETGWTYVMTVPMSFVFSKLNGIRLYTIFGTLLLCAIVIFIINKLVHRNYNPIKELVSRLKALDKVQKVGSNDEFLYIDTIINNIIKNASQSDTLIAKQDKIIQENYVRNYLAGASGCRPSDDDFKINTENIFLYDNYIVIAFYIEDCGNLFSDDSDAADDDKSKFAKIIINNIAAELLEKIGRVYFLEINEILIGIVNSENTDDIASKVKGTIENSQNIIYSYFSLNFSAAISHMHTECNQLPIAYQEAMMGLSHMLSNNDTYITDYAEICDNTFYRYNYSIDVELKLINYIKAGDTKGAINYFQHLYTEEEKNINTIRLFLYDILATVMKLSDGSNVLSVIESDELLQLMDANNTIQALYSGIADIISRLCEAYSNTIAGNSTLVEKVCEYVSNNFSNPMLSVAEIGEYFNKAPSYVSKIFKQERNMGLLEYINKFRIEQAKKLIVNRNESIESIAELVGYTSSKTFTRVFKKYTGVTPSMYKE